MEDNPGPKRPKWAPRHASSEAPYCAFKDDRERRIALVSRDIWYFGCSLVAAAGLVILAIALPSADFAAGIVRVLSRL